MSQFLLDRLVICIKLFVSTENTSPHECACVYVCACVRACVCACVRVCAAACACVCCVMCDVFAVYDNNIWQRLITLIIKIIIL